jgi:mRNA interferase RelE/StbE
MASYRLTFKKSVTKDFQLIPKDDVGRILKRIEALAHDPRPMGSEKLSGKERFRLRQGVYRIVYEIQDEELVIVVVKVGHRREVYRER